MLQRIRSFTLNMEDLIAAFGRLFDPEWTLFNQINAAMKATWIVAMLVKTLLPGMSLT